MSDFLEQAEKALTNGVPWGHVSVDDHETLLRQAITEVRARDKAVELSNGLIADLKAENAKLREAVRHALELAKIIERGDRVEGKNHASSEIVNTLRAALGSDGPGDAS